MGRDWQDCRVRSLSLSLSFSLSKIRNAEEVSEPGETRVSTLSLSTMLETSRSFAHEKGGLGESAESWVTLWILNAGDLNFARALLGGAAPNGVVWTSELRGAQGRVCAMGVRSPNT